MAINRKKLSQRIRVPLGFVFGAVVLIFAQPTPFWLLVGGLISIPGLAIRAWASGHIRKNQKLAVSGPYSLTRNPLYLGSLILGIGLMIGSGVWWLALIFAILFMGIYLPVMSVETDELTAIFGNVYEEYSAAVPLFFPKFGVPNSDEDKFELSLYLRYREYRALLGFLAMIAVLSAKAYFFNN